MEWMYELRSEHARKERTCQEFTNGIVSPPAAAPPKFIMSSLWPGLTTELGKRVVPKLRELAPRSQRESGGGIHAT